MATSNVLHASELATGLQGILKTAHVGAGVNAAAVTIGDLRYIPVNPDEIKKKMPLIVVHPIDESFVKQAMGMTGRWGAIIPFRIFYVALRNDDGGENVFATKMAAAQKIACTLIEKFKLTTVSITNGTIEWTSVDRVLYNPSEEVWLSESRGDLMVVAIEYRVSIVGIVNT
jgi:hypothetical protein